MVVEGVHGDGGEAERDGARWRAAVVGGRKVDRGGVWPVQVRVCVHFVVVGESGVCGAVRVPGQATTRGSAEQLGVGPVRRRLSRAVCGCS